MADARASPPRSGSARRPRRARTRSSPRTARFITFPGFLRAYVESTTTSDAEKDDAERPAAPRRARRRARRRALDPGHGPQHRRPLHRGLVVKRLEELGIGRPSTYASIITTIQDRG
jgi:DNA topoisomerase-1